MPEQQIIMPMITGVTKKISDTMISICMKISMMTTDMGVMAEDIIRTEGENYKNAP